MSIFDEDRLVTPELLKKYSFWTNKSEEAWYRIRVLSHLQAKLTLCFTKYDDGYRVTGELEADPYYYRLRERTIKHEIDFISFMHRMYETNYKYLFEDFELMFS
jgi:hypothetical protein